ncbi:biopolymer transporter ExbB [Rhodobacteraceae bacterium HSP-20]|uniref:Biopolymer transporter ExbB n=1 Tax=Paragemmobacter amnigenus TaxID=2852097 RepID=A0ABS6J2V2_9RHOB|nr:biopolymer transporter ExbB [Rhodobacter amnigenus]MBU9698093.1 biopolymer transporter ExbB [Rhodobacter amnigenus]MBV4389320.1 biopolymer transporter ExbB [Rhodobacter amnigenus]
MEKTRGDGAPTFSQPIRQIVAMLVVCLLVGTGAWFIHREVTEILQVNPLFNGFITAVFLLGVVTCFWQVLILVQSVSWIEDFVRHVPGHDTANPPRLLAPLAALLRSRGARMQISSSSSRSILESVATRIDEARDITRYLANLLVFLGLLGTFFGLATSVPAVVETIRSLAPQEGETGLQVFEKLMSGLESQLGGMGTAFSSSLLGLAGSLVIGLLELFAGHGQNRFYRELEEWLSSITRVSLSSADGEASDTAAMAAVLEQVQAQMDALQSLYTQSDITRVMVEDKIDDLARAVSRLAERTTGESAELLARIAEGQDRLIAAVTSGGGEGAMGADAESRMRLRSIDVQLLKILEEMAAGRQEAIADLRGDLAALTAAIRQLSRGTVGRG